MAIDSELGDDELGEVLETGYVNAEDIQRFMVNGKNTVIVREEKDDVGVRKSYFYELVVLPVILCAAVVALTINYLKHYL